MQETVYCPICHATDAQVDRAPLMIALLVKCPSCGQYRLDGINDINLPAFAKPTRHLMAGIMAERQLRGEPPMTLRMSEWEKLVAAAPATFPEQIDRLLLNLALKSSEPGVPTSLSSDLHARLSYAAAKDSFIYRLKTLGDEGLIEWHGGRKGGLNDLDFLLTNKGWKRVQELQAGGSNSDQAFIALTKRPGGEPDERMDDVVEALKEGVRQAGYRPIFMEDLQHGDRIDDRILVEIKRSRFVVVDTTGRNPNVTFEAGYALGLGRTILWTCRDGDHAEQDFDIRQYRRTLWEHGAEDKLVGRLRDAIQQIIGSGPLKPLQPAA